MLSFALNVFFIAAVKCASMHAHTPLLTISVLGWFLAFGQTAGQPAQNRTFTLPHVETAEQFQEIANLLMGIGDASTQSLDLGQKTITVHGTPEQLALAGWVCDVLDNPGEPVTMAYHMAGVDENTVHLFFAPYAQSRQDFQEVVTAVRAITDMRRMFTYSSSKAIVVRGTADQVAAAAWLFAELGKAPNATTAAPYRMPNGDDEIRVFHTLHTNTDQHFMEVEVTARSIGDVRRMFACSTPRVIAARGTAVQMALSEWLFEQLDRNSPGNAPSREYHLLNETENTVQVFYVPHVPTQAEFQKIAASVRTTTNIRRMFASYTPRAIAVRGTPSQVAVAAQLIAERTKTN